MINYVSINSKLISKNDLLLELTNRGFFFGDGFFETIKVVNGLPFNFQYHWKRIKFASNYLSFDLSINREKLKEDIQLLLDQNNCKQGGKIKIVIYRDSLGNYNPLSLKSSILIFSKSLEINSFFLNKEGVHLDWFNQEFKTASKLSNLKSLNSLIYILAARYAESRKLDDVILFNQNQNPIETSKANIFIQKDGLLYTPSLLEGCVAGTMRAFICEHFEVQELVIDRQFLMDSDELFLSNAIGIRWVQKLGEKQFSRNSKSNEVIELLNTLI